ncbi:MAG: glycosyltransferase [Oscillospiraceae bacterium]|nr:glycosyltransferase [Oscillospiraceae bacterium]
MKIALFTETYTPCINGVVTHISILKKGLEELGHEVLVVTADTETKRYYIENGIMHCPAKGIKKLYGYGLAAPYSSKRLQLLKEFSPDVIHVHQEFGVGLSGFFFAKILKVPLIYTLHTMYDEYVFYVAPKSLVKITKKMLHLYAKKLAESADILVGPSAKVEEFFRSCGVTKKVELVPNTADLDSFKLNILSSEDKLSLKEKLSIPSGHTIGCFIGRLGKEKSVDILLSNFSKTLKGEPVSLIIIGSGPEEEALRCQAEELGLSEQVKFMGAVDHSEVPKYYDISDFFITASVTEMHSISMLEALSSGLIIIQRYDELNASQIEEGVNGYTFTTETDMKEKIMAIHGLTSDEKTELKKTVRATVEKSGAKELAEYLLKFYEQKKEENDERKRNELKR